MSQISHPLSQEEFDLIYSKVPRLTVDIVIKNEDNDIFLSKRSIDYGITAACKGFWHLPGGTVRFGEQIEDAVRRIIKRELGVTINKMTPKGYIEYPSHYKHGMDSPVALVFEVTEYSGDISHNEEAAEFGWFSKMPLNMHADQDVFLVQKGYLSA